MDRPKATSLRLANDWLAHLTNEWAWDRMRDVVATDRDRAWRVIRAIVGCAPDYDVLAGVAAGPVEDFLSAHGATVLPMVLEEAQQNARMRLCLGATYDEFPPELAALIEAETADVRDLPVDPRAVVPAEDLALILAWLHQSDTASSWDLLRELTENDPAQAWDVLRVLAMFAEDDLRSREGIFADAFVPFLERHFSAYRDALVTLGRTNGAFRQWARERDRPAIEDAAMWDAFVAELPQT